MHKDLTPNEAADELRIGRTKLYQLIAEGELESYRIGLRLRRITRPSIDDFKQRHRIEPASAPVTRKDR